MRLTEKGRAFSLLGVLLILGLLFSCASSGTPASSGPAVAGPTDQPMFYGYGKADSATKAMNLAKKEAVRKAADQLIGIAAAMGKKGDLDQFFNDVKDFNIYVFPATVVKIDSGQDDQGFYTTLGVRINLTALANSMKASMIMGGQITGRADASYALADEAAPAGAAVVEAAPAAAKGEAPVEEPAPAAEPAKDVIEVATAEELEFIEDYLGDMTYMVYYNEDQPVDPFLMKTAVVSANRYLNQNGMSYVDLEQIESLKEDQSMVYEEETGEAVSIIQWIAHKLNADVYIEINLSVSSNTRGGKYYGSANLTLNNYEASTADGRGAANYQTNPPAFSTVSEQDALTNAVSSAVFKAMPAALQFCGHGNSKSVNPGNEIQFDHSEYTGSPDAS